jgi:ribosomal protein S18 acetylase RimI-like enzyme
MDITPFRRAEDWFEPIDLTMTIEQFLHLPRHPAYRYHYANGRALLTPRPRYVAVSLNLNSAPPPLVPPEAMRDLQVRQLAEDDWQSLPAIFAAAFQEAAPFDRLEPEKRMRAAQLCLARTRSGADGPLEESASMVTYDPKADNTLLGALIVTRVPRTYGSGRNARMTERTIPHLTWVFVHAQLQRRGTGRMLLDAACAQLRALGETRLASTFLIGNTASMLWHWCSGFALTGAI